VESGVRSSLIGATLAVLIGTATSAQQTPAPSPARARVILLGTAGGPPPHADRSQPASLFEVDGKAYLIDAGENAAQQSLRAGVPPNKLDVVFITHLHWDHTLGLGYLMASGWMMGRTAPLPIWGPPGLADYVQREGAALKLGEDIFRPQMLSRPDLQSLYPVHEADVTNATEIYHDDAVRVSATVTTHFDPAHPASHSYGSDKAYAYRFDTAKGSVTFTGDTGPSDAVTALAKGSDVLVSEIVDVDSIRAALVAAGDNGARLDGIMAHMLHEHLGPEAVGRMAAAAGVKTLVLTHFVMGPGAEADSLVAKIRPFFAGKIVVGHDLTSVDVGRP
jgi:ribonuclease BN (tRNA processing enzyme)